MGSFDWNSQLSYFEHAISEGYIYFQKGSVIMNIDLNDYHTDYVLKDDIWLDTHNADQIISNGSHLYMLSRAKNDIVRLNIKTGSLRNLYTCKGGLGYIHTFRLYEGSLYVIYKSGLIIRIFPDGIREEHRCSELGECRSVLVSEEDDEVYLLDKVNARLIRFRLGSDEFELINLPFVLGSDDSVSVYDSKLYIIHENKLSICELNDASFEQYDIIINENSIERSYPIILTNKIYLLPVLGNRIMILHLSSKELEIYDDYPEDYKLTCSDDFAKKGAKYCGYKKYNGNLYFPCRISDYMMIIDQKTEKIEWKKIEMPSVEKTTEFVMNNFGMIYEDGEANLDVFLKILQK